jgi:SAM-dependent methyltransferase
MARSVSPVVDFYERHPISEAQVLEALRRRGKIGALTPADLYEWDQDHYGGLAAVDALARRASIERRSLVLDVCAGLGGPARFLADRYGARVIGVDLTHARCAAGRRLCRLVRLDGAVRMVNGDAQHLPFETGIFDAVVSQEGLLHIPDKASVVMECARVLRSGGRIAFTDWVATARLGDGERRRLDGWMAAVNLQSIDGYRRLLGRAGFTGVDAEDLSPEWIGLLRERLRMYRGLREHTIARLGAARYDEYGQLYAFFVGLVQAGKLGGARLTGRCGRGTS